jgi:mercuric ion binding protein
MKSPSCIAAALALTFSAGAASAAERTATLEVQNVSCASCAPLVKRALSRVPGVAQVKIVEGASDVATATVTFDDTRTTVAALVDATAKAGFPSKAAP